MGESFGEVFNRIRTGKRLSIRDVAGGKMSVSFVSKFERGETDINISRFLILLENMNVTIEEFYSVAQKASATHMTKLMRKVSKAYYEMDVPKLNALIEQEMALHEETGSAFYKHNAIMIEAFINVTDESPISEAHAAFLSDYLFGIEYWGKYELTIFGNAMTSLAVSTLALLMDELMTKTRLFSLSEENYNAKIGILINAVYTFLEADELEYAKKHMDTLDALRIPDHLLLYRYEVQFLSGLYQIQIGNVETGKYQIESLLSVLNTLGLKTLLGSKEAIYKKAIKCHI